MVSITIARFKHWRIASSEIKELRDISKYFPKDIKVYPEVLYLPNIAIENFNYGFIQTQGAENSSVSDWYNSVLVSQNHLLDLMNLPVTGNQRGPSWTTRGDALQYSPTRVWVHGHSASTSALATAGKLPRWALQKSGSCYLLEIKMDPRE